MKIILMLLTLGTLFADSLTIADSLGLQRAKADIKNSASVTVELAEDKRVTLANGKETLVPTTRNGKIVEFQEVTVGNWKLASDTKVIQVKISEKN